MVHWFKFSGLIVGATILSACMAGNAADLEDEEALDDGQSLIGEARVIFTDANNSCVTRPTTTDASVELTPCIATGTQQWIVRPRSHGNFELVANGSEKCISIEGSSKQDGARAIQKPCEGSNDQLFRIGSASLTHTRLMNVNSGKCLELQQPSSGSGHIIQSRCSDSSAQRWTLP